MLHIEILETGPKHHVSVAECKVVKSSRVVLHG
jgi:hypothetical protein